MLVQILIDNPNSWILEYAEQLLIQIRNEFKFEAKLVHNHQDIIKGDVLCLLGCEKIFKNLKLNKYNLVVHESDLPKGKGWSPLTWQVLEGKKKIPITLFEATEKVDAGKIYKQDFIELEGHELLPEIKHLQGLKTNNLILDFLKNFPLQGKNQQGEESFYSRRGPKDSQLSIEKTIKEQFNLLRVCDNERYPAFFYLNDKKYILKIFKEDE